MPSEKQTRAAIERTAKQIKENSRLSYSEAKRIATNSAIKQDRRNK